MLELPVESAPTAITVEVDCRSSRWAKLAVRSGSRNNWSDGSFVRALRDPNLHDSMGRLDACADNAAMESFFSLLQKNVLNSRRWRTRDDLRLAIITGIEKTCHRRRRQDRLGQLTLIEYETLLQAANAG